MLPRHLENERGATLVAAGLTLGALLAFAVVAVDLGRLAFTATEVQTVADIAATAGAKALLLGKAPVSEAKRTVAQSKVDGKTAEIAPPGQIQQGHYDFTNASFVVGGTPANAVKADAEATVQNILASLLGTRMSTVQKTATAAFSPIASGQPTLPLALADCKFPPECTDQSCLPQQLTTPSTDDNSAWTGFLGGSSQGAISNYFPSPCGGDQDAPTLLVDQTISLTNGQLTPLYKAVQCLVCQLNTNEFLVPIIPCGTQLNQGAPVAGFATIQIDRFHFSNGKDGLCNVKGGVPQAMTFSTVFRTNEPGAPGGCPGCGTGFVTLVK